jgi:hypothetical protein
MTAASVRPSRENAATVSVEETPICPLGFSSGRASVATRAGQDVEGANDLLDMREHHVQDCRLRVDVAAYGYVWLRARRASDGAARPLWIRRTSLKGPYAVRDEEQPQRRRDQSMAVVRPG